MAYVPRSDAGRILRRAILITAVLLIAGCDESLPPRLPVPNAIAVGVNILGPLILVEGGNPSGPGGTVEVTAVNAYTEVLQDTPAVDIQCRLWLASRPESEGDTVMDLSSLTNHALIQNGLLTLAPGDSAFFVTHWNYRSAGGTPFWNYLPLTSDSDGKGPFLISQPVQVMVTVTMRVFRDVPAYTLGPSSFTLQFKIR